MLEPESHPQPALLVFADDWGRHPSSCQYIIRQLLHQHDVYWVNTIGTRSPRLNWATLKRGAEKLRQWLRPSKTDSEPGLGLDAPQPRVLNPRMCPWFGSASSRWLNRVLLRRQLLPCCTR
jgi:hypothetical protein